MLISLFGKFARKEKPVKAKHRIVEKSKQEKLSVSDEQEAQRLLKDLSGS